MCPNVLQFVKWGMTNTISLTYVKLCSDRCHLFILTHVRMKFHVCQNMSLHSCVCRDSVYKRLKYRYFSFNADDVKDVRETFFNNLALKLCKGCEKGS